MIGMVESSESSDNEPSLPRSFLSQSLPKPIFTNSKKGFEHIELPAKLLNNFLRSNKSNINQSAELHARLLSSSKLSSFHFNIVPLAVLTRRAACETSVRVQEWFRYAQLKEGNSSNTFLITVIFACFWFNFFQIYIFIQKFVWNRAF